MRERFAALGFIAGDGNPDALKKRIINDYAKWGRVIPAARLALE